MTHYEKMNEEMKQTTSPIEERVHLYLCSLGDSDTLINRILQEDKTIINCAKYLYHKGSKLACGGVADVTAEMEIDWIKEYYNKDKVTENELQILPATAEKVFVDREVEKIVEVEKIIYKAPTTVEEIAEYAKQSKQAKATKKEVKEDVMEGLF